ncbi:MAG: hypothetical protein KAT90_15165, partial [Gammaproteobacteria bacterium]|nr:hypothetical protein [Gammaproteobacteria bacterium]
MSLLLDALKKAAADKQKTSQQVSNNVRSQKAEKSVDANENIVKDTEELTLEDNVESHVEKKAVERKIESLPLDDSEQGNNRHSDNPLPDDIDLAVKENIELSLEDSGDSKAAEFSVSDDALQMLIYKTNRDAGKNKKIVFSSVLIISLIIIISGGVYYYLDMQIEIEALERKHKIAMQSMRLKTNRENVPERAQAIQHLVDNSVPDKKVPYVKQAAAVEKRTVKNNLKSAPVLSIKRTNKTDPVAETLDAAWLAYDAGRYDEASASYKDVLNIEEYNQDALHGLGAIAVIKKNNAVAREIYLSLLEQDPRDAMATAALVELGDESATKTDEEYLLSMLEKNPGAQHLSFALANNYAKQKRWKFAQQYYFDAWKSDPENPDYLFNLAVSMEQLNKPQQA